VEVKHLAFKAVFLLSLASGARRSEIHALDHSLTRWSDGYKEVFLRPYVGFMAKTHVARDPSTALRGFRIRSFRDAHDPSEPDRALCPLRALRYYLHRTAHLRAGRRPLFLPLSHTASGRLCPNTISSWLKQTIILAYEIAATDEDFQRLHSVSAHECRALSASWSALRNVSTDDIISACRWRAHTTFTSFYLRDLVEAEGQLLVFKHVPSVGH